MQKIATKIFIYASLAFGVVGVTMVLALPGKDQPSSELNIILTKLLMLCVFIILPSFALSVAGKYLNGKQ